MSDVALLITAFSGLVVAIGALVVSVGVFVLVMKVGAYLDSSPRVPSLPPGWSGRITLESFQGQGG